MTKRIGDVLYVETEPEQQCDLCGQIAELRLYGANGEKICFECGMKNPEATEKAYLKSIQGVKEVIELD